MLENRINRIMVKNYRSLADVTVEMADLTVLVGENGSGKSNFLDVLHLILDALKIGLEEALSRRYSSSSDLLFFNVDKQDIEIKLDLTVKSQKGVFHTILGYKPDSFGIHILSEFCQLGEHRYHIKDTKLTDLTLSYPIAIQEQNFALHLLGSTKEFTPLYRFLSQMRFYSIFPKNPRFFSSLENTLGNLDEQAYHEIGKILATIVPDISPKNPINKFPIKKGYGFLIEINHGERMSLLEQESDGTLRVLALLTAIYQKVKFPLIGIEEPELMIHPHALAVLSDCFKEVSQRGQLLISTHSPDLVARVAAENMRVVEMVNGATQIAPLRDDQIQTINDKLFNGGDLLRIEGLKRE